MGISLGIIGCTKNMIFGRVWKCDKARHMAMQTGENDDHSESPFSDKTTWSVSVRTSRAVRNRTSILISRIFQVKHTKGWLQYIK